MSHPGECMGMGLCISAEIGSSWWSGRTSNKARYEELILGAGIRFPRTVITSKCFIDFSDILACLIMDCGIVDSVILPLLPALQFCLAPSLS